MLRLARAKHLPHAGRVPTASLRNACTALGVGTHGSDNELINNMIAELVAIRKETPLAKYDANQLLRPAQTPTLSRVCAGTSTSTWTSKT